MPKTLSREPSLDSLTGKNLPCNGTIQQPDHTTGKPSCLTLNGYNHHGSETPARKPPAERAADRISWRGRQVASGGPLSCERFHCTRSRSVRSLFPRSDDLGRHHRPARSKLQPATNKEPQKISPEINNRPHRCAASLFEVVGGVTADGEGGLWDSGPVTV